MSFYFVCPGEVSVGTYEVQCSVEIQTVDSPDANSGWITKDQQEQLLGAVILIWAIIFVYREIRRLLL